MIKLFSLPMLGQGTADVESLSSYVLRLAYEHGVSAGTLLASIFEASGQGGCTARPGLGGRTGIETLSRVNAFSKRLRVQLSEAVGQDLFCWPLHFLDKQVYQISTDIGGFRWCPECFAEMSQVGAPRYIKQLWHMAAVIHCPLHRTPLVGTCPNCGSEQVFMHVDTCIGWCGKCGHSLAERAKTLTADDIQPSWACMAHDLLDVYSKAARAGQSETSFGSCKMFVADLLNEFTESMKSDDSMPPDLKLLMAEYARNQHRFWRVITMRRLAYLLNVSLYDLLSSNYRAIQLPYKPSTLKELPTQIKPRKKVVRNHKQEYQKIVAIIEAQPIPPSLKRLARLANVSVGYMEYRFPSLVRQVVDKSQAYQKRELLIRRYRAQAAALQFFTDDRYADHTRSRKEAFRVLKEETGLPKWVLKNAIQTAYGVFQVGAG